MNNKNRNLMSNSGVSFSKPMSDINVYMSTVYSVMAFGISLSGLIAYFVSKSTYLINFFFNSGLGLLFILSPYIINLIIRKKIEILSARSVFFYFIAFASLIGVSFSYIFLVFKIQSILQIFLSSISLFSLMSAFGFVTKKDLTGIGSFLIVGVFGLLISILINFFMKSPLISYVLSWFTVIIFTGLTAYDTQRIRQLYQFGSDKTTIIKVAVLGGLILYTNFINIFSALLRIFGERK